MNVAFPIHYDALGRTATATDENHVREMIEQILFTCPGERVNRPDFGCGLNKLVFSPNSPELAATVQCVTQAALQRFLGDLIEPISVVATPDHAKLTICVKYALRRTGDVKTEDFERSVS